MAYLMVSETNRTPYRVNIDQRAVIGRNPDCTVQLQEPHSSRRHAVIYCQDDEWYIRDMNTRNGTKVNEEKITDHRLKSGDKITIGKAALVFTADSSSNKRIGGYEIVDEIAHCSYSRVYRVRRAGQEKIYAMKVFDRKTFGPAIENVFITMRAVATVYHTNIAAVIEVNPAGDDPYYVMEYVAGKNLGEIIGGPLPPEMVRRVTLGIAEGLAAAHARGVVHGNIKPRNVIIDESGKPTIVDFGGICPVDPPKTRPSNTAAFAGVPFYLSPEQISNDPVDPRSDIYSLGAVLFSMLRGSPPFTGSTDEIIMKQHLAEEPDLEGIPGEPFTGVLRRMLAKDPAKRLQTMQEVARLLASDASTPVPVPGTSEFRRPEVVKPEKQLVSAPRSRSQQDFNMSFFSGIMLILLLASVFIGAREIGRMAREQIGFTTGNAIESTDNEKDAAD